MWPLLLDLGTEASVQVCTGTSDNTDTNTEVKQTSASADPGADSSASFQPIIAKKTCCTVRKICKADTHFIQSIVCSQLFLRNRHMREVLANRVVIMWPKYHVANVCCINALEAVQWNRCYLRASALSCWNRDPRHVCPCWKSSRALQLSCLPEKGVSCSVKL